ncbi:MAG: DUF3459 domain-containing protein [Burkholderiales bacterium]|nr:DUF3459 domain-containing protein [Burkholderiales bacterium]
MPRVRSRWGGKDAPAQFAALLLAMQLALKGTPCLYQGEELALSEAEIAFEDLQDPYGIAFWPEFKGRDGCRTPLPWDAKAPQAGFSSARPCLPPAPEHAALAVSVQQAEAGSMLNFTRGLLAWRKQNPQLRRGEIAFFDAPEPVLALRRDLAGAAGVLAAFNLGGRPVQFAWPESAAAQPLNGHGLPGSAGGGIVRLPAHGA